MEEGVTPCWNDLARCCWNRWSRNYSFKLQRIKEKLVAELESQTPSSSNPDGSSLLNEQEIFKKVFGEHRGHDVGLGRYNLERKAFKIIQDMDRLMEEKSSYIIKLETRPNVLLLRSTAFHFPSSSSSRNRFSPIVHHFFALLFKYFRFQALGKRLKVEIFKIKISSLDVLEGILKNLPVKSVIRFISLCKRAQSLIRCSYFISAYNPPQHRLVIKYEVGYTKDSEAIYVCFVDVEDDTFPHQSCSLTVPRCIHGTIYKGITMLGSAQGLLCFTSSYSKSVILWNPAISKWIAVVIPNPVDMPYDFVIGFGICPNKDPTLVKITYIDVYKEIEKISCIQCQVMVFTLSSGEWTTLSSNNLPRKSIGFTNSQTSIGQFIYWLVYDRIAENAYRNLIMSFDMGTLEFREIDLPDNLARLGSIHTMIYRLGESLAVVEEDVNDLLEDVGVVRRMDDGDSNAFTQQFTIDPPNASYITTVGFRKNGQPIVQILDEDNCTYHRPPLAVVVYDPSVGQIKHLGISSLCQPMHSIVASSYSESVLLLNYDDGHIRNVSRDDSRHSF